MANSRNYRTPSEDDDADVPYWNDLLAQDVAADLDTKDAEIERIDSVIPEETPFYGEEYRDATVDAAGNLIEGITADGTSVVARSRILGDVGTLQRYKLHSYISGTVDADGNMLEDVLDANGMVPQWVLDKWAARMGAAALEASAPVWLFLIEGQSNAMNKSDWLEEAVDVEDSWVMLWDSTTNKWRTIRPDETWLGLYFGQEWVRRYRGTKVGLVPAAVGDTGFDVTRPAGTWTRTDTTNPINLYNRALTMYAAAKAALTAAGTTFIQGGILWSQGEADSRTMTEAQYAAAIDDLIAAQRAAIGIPKLPFVLGSLTPELYYEYEPPLPTGVNDALRDTPRRVLYTAFVQAPNDYAKFNERVHYSVAGQRKRGAMFVEAVRRARLNLTLSKPIAPPGLTVRRSGTEILINWEAPECRVTTYALKTSTDSGANWTTQALPAPLVTSFTLTAAAGLPVWARVACTNEQGTSYYSIPYHG